jgi:hypothetical protein
LAIFSVAEFAFLRVDNGALLGRAAAGRQCGTIRPDANVPSYEIGLGDWFAAP